MGTPLRVLIIEDSEDDLALTVHELSRHDYDLTYTRVETAETMRAALDRETWDVILSDYSMPQFSALAALRVLREKDVEIPFIIISGTVGEETAVAAMKAGAHDFFAKDKLTRLIPAIEREMREAGERRKRRWAEEELRQAEERFSKAFHAGPVGISIMSLADIFIDVNDAFLQLTGYSQEEVISHTSLELELWVDLTARTTIIQGIRDGKTIRDQELQFRTKSGAVLDFFCSFAAVELAGQPCMLSMVHDITERKRMAEERSRLLEQEQLASKAFLDMLERIAEGFVILDRQWNYVYANPKAGELLGRESETLVGKNVWVEFPEAINGPHYGALHQAVSMQSTVEIEAFFEPWKRWFINRIYPSDNGVTVFFQDVTERKRHEREALEAERMRGELAKERELILLKEGFISIVSHEFRTPLTAIMSSAELVQRYYDQLPRDRQLYYVRDILLQAGFMTRLLDDILTVNKSRAGHMEFKPISMNLKAFCETMIERLRIQDDEKHHFVVEMDGNLENVEMDERLLQHILVNLLTNAVKYSPDGGEVRLEVTRRNGEITFRVIDHGIGIPPENLARLYEPFQRADNVGTIRGTGLGLAIVKESVDRHGGTIECQTKIKKGTTIIVRLPATPFVPC